MGLDGVEIFTNSSGSHHELRKLYRRVEVMKEATEKVGLISVHVMYIRRGSKIRFGLGSPVAYTFTPINKAATATAYTTMDVL